MLICSIVQAVHFIHYGRRDVPGTVREVSDAPE